MDGFGLLKLRSSDNAFNKGKKKGLNKYIQSKHVVVSKHIQVTLKK